MPSGACIAAIGCSITSAVSLVFAGTAAAFGDGTWYRTKRGFAYCEDGSSKRGSRTFTCFSPVSGRWIRFEYPNRQNARFRITRGRDQNLVGFRRTTRITTIPSDGITDQAGTWECSSRQGLGGPRKWEYLECEIRRKGQFDGDYGVFTVTDDGAVVLDKKPF
jgi:hypothetical protein